MDNVALHDFEERLLRWRETLEQQMRPVENAADDSDALARQSADMAASLDNLWRQALVAQTREIELALEKLRAGGYGVCEQCGEGISLKRLEVIPWARKCFPCQSSLPQQRTSLSRYCTAAALRWYSPS